VKWWVLLLAAVVIAGATISRSPDFVLRPQFWGDEARWFVEAYSRGFIRSLLEPQRGYLCIASKLPELIAVHVPLAKAPAVFNWYTIAIQTLTFGYLLTGRLAHVASFHIRALLCAVWIAVPNAAEIYSLTDSQWNLAVLGALIVLSAPPVTTAWKVFDVVSIALISVTGPFGILLTLIAGVYWIVRRVRWTLVIAGVLIAGSCLQVITLAHALESCRTRELTNPLALRIIAGQVFLFGTAHAGNLIAGGNHETAASVLSVVVITLGLAAVAYCVARGPVELKLLLAFAGLVALSAFRRLQCDPGWDWISMMDPAYAVRYWYIERLAFFAVLLWLAVQARNLAIRGVAGSALALVVFSSATHWKYPPRPDLHFSEYANAFDKLPRGTQFTIPVNPPGWEMKLVKR
jgi:hypothetical protein